MLEKELEGARCSGSVGFDGVIGFSQGALVASLLVAKHPGLFKFAVLLSSGDCNDAAVVDKFFGSGPPATGAAAPDATTTRIMSFAGDEDPLVTVEACRGYDIEKFSFFQGVDSEFEVLFRPLARFEIKGTEKNIKNPKEKFNVKKSGTPDAVLAAARPDRGWIVGTPRSISRAN